MKWFALASPVFLIAGCGEPAKQAHCPDPARVAPASIGGAGYVANLTARLGSSDRENVVAEAISEMRRAAPDMNDGAITNVLIAADCPVAAAKPDHDAAADRHRIATFRGQIDQMLANSPESPPATGN